MITLGVMKRLAATAAVALSLIGCGPSGGGLVTYDGPCYVASITGKLVVDPSGTAMVPVGDGPHTGTLRDRMIVAWPPGYTARPNGSEVDVLDAHGGVVATTGNIYTLLGGDTSAGWLVCMVNPGES